jgi:hypothetical protein
LRSVNEFSLSVSRCSNRGIIGAEFAAQV